MEDLPEHHNRVELSPSLADADGVPAPAVHYRFSENTRALMAFQVERATESLAASGATDIEASVFIPNGHFMGTARMGLDPATSVVDPWCVSHDIPNLLIVDGSVFVTAGCANPTSTIGAIALRAAEHLIANKPATTPRQPVSIGLATTTTAVAVRPSPRSPLPLTDQQRRTIEAVADAVLPSDGRMPLPSAVGLGNDLMDRVLAARPDLAAPVLAAIADADALRLQVLDRVNTIDKSVVRAFTTAIAGAYYLSPVVRRLIGFDPTSVAPVRPDAYPEYLAEGLLDHLV